MMRRQVALPQRRIVELTVAMVVLTAPLLSQQNGSWKFAVSGDSRNCGDIVMPAIAAGVRADGAAFYWHLGDYRAIYTFDEDWRSIHSDNKDNISFYLADAWPDFIKHQLAPFGDLPVYLTAGNHEIIWPMTRERYISQFADWLDQENLRKQRLADNQYAHALKTYNHWIERGVDFISMDNTDGQAFDAGQLAWFDKVMDNAEKDARISSVVVGMHAALPDSASAGHSMNETREGLESGNRVYARLSKFHKATRKNVYILASHTHFVMDNLYDTSCHKGDVLPGWITGSAGAIRYPRPTDIGPSQHVLTKVYGYQLATVAADGSITFEFKEVTETQVPAGVSAEFGDQVVKWCFDHNDSDKAHPNPPCGMTTGQTH
jgi:calcineurin-like phosphoesterase family protein